MNGNNEPLHGIKAVNLSLNLPGPAAALKLSQLGASVIKIEPPEGDPFSEYCLSWYEALCVKQTVLRLDLKTAMGRDKIDHLLKESDLILTSFRPSALEKLGLGWKELHSRYPRLCQVAIVGHPSPDHNKAGHDLTYQAALGLLSPPHFPRTFLADLAGAEKAVSSALGLLYAREGGSGAGYIEVALSECAQYFTEPLRYGLTVPGGMFGGGLPRYNIYETRQGWIAVAALEPHFWERLKGELGLCKSDVSYAQLQEIFLTKNAAEWETWAASFDLPIVAVR
jgi:crotonobetainyl-CoA:carnitine CoA-transferase CaiB-like acyl-CoA transferase